MFSPSLDGSEDKVLQTEKLEKIAQYTEYTVRFCLLHHHLWGKVVHAHMKKNKLKLHKTI